MSSDNNRLRFHMGCGERLQSRRWIVRCVSGALLNTRVKPVTGKAEHARRPRVEDQDKS